MDFWSYPADLRLIAGTGKIDRKQPLPVASEFEDRLPGLGQRLAQVMLTKASWIKATQRFEYGLLVSPNWPVSSLGLLQTDLDLGMSLPYCYLIMWHLDHPSARIILHHDLHPHMVAYKLPEGTRYV